MRGVSAKVRIAVFRFQLSTAVMHKCHVIAKFYNSCRSWNDELEKSLRDMEDHMKLKCETYFSEIKNETVKVQ